MNVHCKDCGKEISADDAYHVQPKGFRCQCCHNNHFIAQMALIVILIIGALIFVGFVTS